MSILVDCKPYAPVIDYARIDTKTSFETMAHWLIFDWEHLNFDELIDQILRQAECDNLRILISQILPTDPVFLSLSNKKSHVVQVTMKIWFRNGESYRLFRDILVQSDKFREYGQENFDIYMSSI